MSAAVLWLVDLGPGDPGLVTLRARDAVCAARRVHVVVANVAHAASLVSLVSGLGVANEAVTVGAPEPSADLSGIAIVHGAHPDDERVATASAEALASRAGLLLLRVPGVTLEAAERSTRALPLRGKRVLILRAKEQAQDAESTLLAYGAVPLSVPALTIEPPPEPALLEQAVRDAGTYGFIVFTSRNGVDRFFDVLCNQLGKDARHLSPARIAAIGPKTAEALAERGVRADLVAKDFVGEALAAELSAALGPAPARILIPRALVARDVVPDTLRALGHTVLVVPAYETRGPTAEDRARLAEAFQKKEVHAILFTSSSTVTHTLAALGPDAASILASACVVSIGPVTTATAEQQGVRVDVTAKVYTVEGAVLALSAFSAEKG